LNVIAQKIKSFIKYTWLLKEIIFPVVILLYPNKKKTKKKKRKEKKRKKMMKKEKGDSNLSFRGLNLVRFEKPSLT
jgi:hypothetical protein